MYGVHPGLCLFFPSHAGGSILIFIVLKPPEGVPLSPCLILGFERPLTVSRNAGSPSVTLLTQASFTNTFSMRTTPCLLRNGGIVRS